MFTVLFGGMSAHTLEILEGWKEAGAEIWAIRVRPGTEGDPVRDFISETFGIPRENVYFEKPKTERIRATDHIPGKEARALPDKLPSRHRARVFLGDPPEESIRCRRSCPIEKWRDR
jgi:hypothetical protein